MWSDNVVLKRTMWLYTDHKCGPITDNVVVYVGIRFSENVFNTLEMGGQ